MLATTQHGGHLGRIEGIMAKSLWWVRAIDEYLCALNSNSLIHREKVLKFACSITFKLLMNLKMILPREIDAMVSKFKRIYVFCGSSQGKKNSYQDPAIELGKELISRNIDLVYREGRIGLMGLVSQAVHDGGRHVIGVIPKTLMPRELTGEMVGEVMTVADMHQRKAEMARHSDAFITLPGWYKNSLLVQFSLFCTQIPKG
ncbi:putative cytokinin riboside 5'-monophosphate phosphoribohydrolase LOGL6 [Capsicum chinense]|nr:putative cytokinin riboside 5'-monophosphate phosphoribohydrolase LOGL6 [Capsicum chinense]